MNRHDLLDWFEAGELEPCERCGQRAGLRIVESGTFICFGCGFIRWAEGETFVDSLQAGAGRPAMERPILELLDQHGSLAYDQVVARLDEPPDMVRGTLGSLRDRGLVEVLTTGETEGHYAGVPAYWRLTDAGREDLDHRRRST
jgi:DNA-binding transcriptional ArsR family regulator